MSAVTVAGGTKIEWADFIERGDIDVFVKQLGSVLGRELEAGSKGQDFERFPSELRIRDFPGGRS